ncbi:uncharacterized protein LOC111261658 [Varroa jacobsoni]|uniref:uncharacterized protein LOC111261658 n=1 Tax=Varroa jacobsoni TaxID=62625 RepID=UPI000BF2FD28|nr:uncharacterized protein LOC111261658 [Varroa jacobsoni]
MTAIDPWALQVVRHESTQAISPEVIAISSDENEEPASHPAPTLHPTPTPGPSTSTANSQLMALMPFRDDGSASRFGPIGWRNAPPNLNNAIGSVAASGDEIGDELYRSAIHIVLNQVINNSGTTNNTAPPTQNECNRPSRLSPDEEPLHNELGQRPSNLRHLRNYASKPHRDLPSSLHATDSQSSYRISGRPRPGVLRVTRDLSQRQGLEHLMSSSSSDPGTASVSGSATDSGSDADEETESDTEVDDQDESQWYGANGHASRPNSPTSNRFYGSAPSSASAIAKVVTAFSSGPSTAAGAATAVRTHIEEPMPSSLMGSAFEPTLGACSASSATPSRSQAAVRKSSAMESSPGCQQQEQQRLKDEAEKEKERQERLAIQVEIELRVPRLPQYGDIEVTTSNGTKLKANFPEATTIEAGAKSPRKPPRPLRKIIHGHDPNILQQAIKHHEETIEAAESLKKFQMGSILQAKWLPDRHKAEVTLRRGKMIETMGSATNPVMLEFYEALYLLERGKLHLVCSEGVPMSVFDAYATLLRNEADHELHLLFEYLMEGSCIVVPYKKPPKRRKPTAKDSTEEEKLLLAAQSLALPVVPAQSAFSKDSDSDLEIISCNMPLPDNKDKTPKEIELAYTPGPIYKGKPISFVDISCAGQSLILPTIPPELSPACVAHDVSNANGVNKTTTVGSQPSNVFIAGRSLTILEEWVTALGSEKVDPLNEETGEYLELSPITKGRLRKRKGDCSTTKKGAATKRGKRNKQFAAMEAAQAQMHSTLAAMLQQGPVPGSFMFPPGSAGTMPDASTERFHRRWFPRWFDGLELGVHSSSVQSTLHRFTRDGIPLIPFAKNWYEYKQEFARIVAERGSGVDNVYDKRSALYSGTTKPMMTGTKGNMTSLIFEELTLGKEVTENLAALLEGFGRLADGDEDKTDKKTTDQSVKALSEEPTKEGQPQLISVIDVPQDNNHEFRKKHSVIVKDEQNYRADKTSSLITPDLLQTVLSTNSKNSLIGHLNGTSTTASELALDSPTMGAGPDENTISIPLASLSTDLLINECKQSEGVDIINEGIGTTVDILSSKYNPSESQQQSSSSSRNEKLEPSSDQQRDQLSPPKSAPPRIVFDVYTDSEYSKNSPSLPDFRVVLLPNGSKGLLKFRDLVRLSVEADDTTLLIAHVVDGRVRTRQVMPFSIPRYN